jgi:hypothetical protein
VVAIIGDEEAGLPGLPGEVLGGADDLHRRAMMGRQQVAAGDDADAHGSSADPVSALAQVRPGD